MNDERQLLITVRKTLAKVAKDTSVTGNAPHPLQQSTINAMRECFALVAERERQLAAQDGVAQNERPRYADEPKKTNVISFVDAKRKPKA